MIERNSLLTFRKKFAKILETMCFYGKDREMIVCTFFGHRDAPSDIKSMIRDAIVDLITNKGVDMFMVGDSGNFDRMVNVVLKELEPHYEFNYQIVISRIPGKKTDVSSVSSETPTILPNGIENIIPKFAIDYRNNYMLSMSDFVITYIVRSYGGAAKYYNKAISKNKIVINIAEK